MKKILVSWYGITDLCSSFGFESNGPLIAAMRAESYDSVHILQYVDDGKFVEDEEVENASIGLLQGIKQSEFIARICNTPAANRHFETWLRRTVAQENIRSEIYTHTVNLKGLNDSDGIYAAVVSILDRLAYEKDVQITLDISPGTAVMAFVWSFAALRYPSADIRLITSPRKDFPPEEVQLPAQVRKWHGRDIGRSLAEQEKYDVVYHLFGEQRMPALLGVINFPAKRHVFITTSRYPAEVMKMFVGQPYFEEVRTDAFSASQFMLDVGEHVKKQSSHFRMGFNLTGGTKIMYACALELAREYGILPFYFDIQNNRVINLQDFSSIPTATRLNIPQIIQLNSRTSLRGLSNEEREVNTKRLGCAKKIKENYGLVRKAYDDLIPYANTGAPFESIGRGRIEFGLDVNYHAYAKFPPNFYYDFERWEGFAKYLTGGWFEEYVWHYVVMPLKKEGIVTDVRLNVELHSVDSRDEDVYQELDVVFTDGQRLYIIECKSGALKGEYVEKLHSIVREYGGVAGKGILCYMARPVHKTVHDKAQAYDILLCHVDALQEEIRNLLKS